MFQRWDRRIILTVILSKPGPLIWSWGKNLVWRLHVWAPSNLGNGWRRRGSGRREELHWHGSWWGWWDTWPEKESRKRKHHGKGKTKYQVLLRHRGRASRRQLVAYKRLFERLVGDVGESRLCRQRRAWQGTADGVYSLFVGIVWGREGKWASGLCACLWALWKGQCNRKELNNTITRTVLGKDREAHPSVQNLWWGQSMNKKVGKKDHNMFRF